MRDHLLVEVAKSYDIEKAWSSTNHSILSEWNLLQGLLRTCLLHTLLKKIGENPTKEEVQVKYFVR
jgi:hypothetical protein